MLEPGKLAYGIKEVGRAINAGQSTVYEYIKTGRIRAVKHGRRTLVLADDLRRYLSSLPAIPAEATSAQSDPKWPANPAPVNLRRRSIHSPTHPKALPAARTNAPGEG